MTEREALLLAIDWLTRERTVATAGQLAEVRRMPTQEIVNLAGELADRKLVTIDLHEGQVCYALTSDGTELIAPIWRESRRVIADVLGVDEASLC